MIPLHIQQVINRMKAPKISAIDNIHTDIDKLLVLNNNNTCYIDSHNFSMRLKEIYDILEKTENSIEIIKIADFLADKLYGMFLFNKQKQTILINKLSNAIYTENTENYSIIRPMFLLFRDNKVVYSTCMNLFDRNIDTSVFNIDLLLNIYKFLIYRADIDIFSQTVIEKYSKAALKKSQELFEDENISLFAKMEIADIMLLNGYTDVGNRMLDIIRERENIILTQRRYEIIPPLGADLLLISGHNVTTIYQDTQNVHNNDINNSILNVSVNLLQISKPENYDIESIVKELSKYEADTKKLETIKDTLCKLYINTSRFTLKENSFSLHDVFASLWTYILSHKHREELILRLIEELLEMSEYCSTGYLSRLINVIQGFTDDESLQVKILEKTRIKAVIFNILDKYFMNRMDSPDIFDIRNLFSFLDMVKSAINENISDLYKENGNIGEYIIDAVKNYTKFNAWYLDEKENIDFSQ